MHPNYQLVLTLITSIIIIILIIAIQSIQKAMFSALVFIQWLQLTMYS